MNKKKRQQEDVLEKAEKVKREAKEACRMANCALVVAIVGISVTIVAGLDKIVAFTNWLRSFLG